MSEFSKVCERRKLRVNVGKSKGMICSMDIDVSKFFGLLNEKLSVEVQCFKYLGSHVEKTELVETKMRPRVKERSNVLGALQSAMSCKTLGMETRKKDRVVVPTVSHGAETWRVRAEDKLKLNFLETKCTRSMAGVTLMNGINNDVERIRTVMVRKLEDRVDSRVLRWYWHMARMHEKRLVKRVMKAELSSRRPRGRPKYGWIDDVKQALERRYINGEEVRECALNWRKWGMVVKGCVLTLLLCAFPP